LFKIDMEHYWKVKRAREKLGLKTSDDVKIVYPPLLGRQFLNKKNNKIYTVQEIKHEWYMGGFVIRIVIENNGSHGARYIENHGCICEHIQNSIDEFYNTFTLLD